jgi:hypothetical protein
MHGRALGGSTEEIRLARGVSGQLIEHEYERRDASREHYDSKRRSASRYEPEPTGSELPSQSEERSLAQHRADEPERQEGDRDQKPAGRTKLDERPVVGHVSLSARLQGDDVSMLSIVGLHPARQGHLRHDSQRRSG